LALLMPLLLLSMARGKLATYVLPCIAPFTVLMADALIDASSEVRRRVMRGSAWVVLAASATVLMLLVVVAVAFKDHQWIAGQGVALAGIGIIPCLWAAVAVAMLMDRIPLLAGLALLVPCAIPALPLIPRHEALTRSMPQPTLREYVPLVGTNTKVAVALARLPPALAWELKRADLVIVGSPGEFEYGLGYLDASGRWVSMEGFRVWLATERRARQVVLFATTELVDCFPPADQLDRRGELSVLWYHRRGE